MATKTYEYEIRLIDADGGVVEVTHQTDSRADALDVAKTTTIDGDAVALVVERVTYRSGVRVACSEMVIFHMGDADALVRGAWIEMTRIVL